MLNNKWDFFVVPDSTGSWNVISAGRLVGAYDGSTPALNVARSLAQTALRRHRGVQVHVLQEDGDFRTAWTEPGVAPRYGAVAA